MSALTADRNTPRYQGEDYNGTVAAAQLIFAGALVMRNAAGFLLKGQTATGLVGVGRAEARIDNSAGGAGDAFLDYRPGTYRFANSAAADEITIAEIGDLCWAVDDQTVAKTDGTGTRSPAGIARRKLVLLSTVTVPCPGFRFRKVAVPPMLSQIAMTAPPCSVPLRFRRSGAATISATTSSGLAETICMPR